MNRIYPQLDQMGISIPIIEIYAFQIAKEDMERENERVLITIPTKKQKEKYNNVT